MPNQPEQDNWLDRLAVLISQLTKYLLESFNIVVIVFFTGFILVIAFLMLIFKLFLGNGV